MPANLVSRGSRLFGSPQRTDILVLLALLGDSYPTEIARLLDGPLRSAQRILEDLEDEGVVASRLLGRTRLVRLNPRFFAARELEVLLLRLGEGDPRLRRVAASRRARPRRGGKEL